eukprot:TRINITY_DN770_c0_g1_i1.p1 TRINITY_DN770_c0_g1~~TRINITY_DN770_c0_g1_i1.p1  ORF type:complete len:203 (-),score=61.90 TRINITY_DN770_c0_g1_i1:51-617(-)
MTVMGRLGKTALVNRYIQGSYSVDYESDMETSHSRRILMDGGVIVVEVLDTCGLTEYESLYTSWIRTSEGLILVYPIKESISAFEELKKIAALAEETKEKKIPLLVVGTMLDLEEERKLSTQQGEAFAKSIGAAFIETSAKTNENVDLAFEKMTRMILKAQTERWEGVREERKEKKVKPSKDSSVDLP